MHIQVTIISRLKAALSEAKGKERWRGARDLSSAFTSRLCSLPRTEWAENTVGKKHTYPENVKWFLNEAGPLEGELLILKGCCCTGPSGGVWRAWWLVQLLVGCA